MNLVVLTCSGSRTHIIAACSGAGLFDSFIAGVQGVETPNSSGIGAASAAGVWG